MPYNGERTAKAIHDWTARRVPTLVKKLKEVTDIAPWVESVRAVIPSSILPSHVLTCPPSPPGHLQTPPPPPNQGQEGPPPLEGPRKQFPQEALPGCAQGRGRRGGGDPGPRADGEVNGAGFPRGRDEGGGV